MEFLVVWGLLEMMETRSPSSLFIRVDLPTFGLPMIVTNPDLNFVSIILLLLI
jgi:hypothetical protein